MTLTLVDKSAYEQQRHHEAADELLRALGHEGDLATCEMIALEVLYSARNASDYRARRDLLDSLMWLPVDNQVMRRALEVQGLLVASGQHRRPIPDLVIAATAEIHGAVVLHYDKDFDLIADVTKQPVRWIVPPRGRDPHL